MQTTKLFNFVRGKRAEQKADLNVGRTAEERVKGKNKVLM